MNRLVLNDQGFVDLRRNPPAEKDQVNGWTPENGEPPPKVETVPVEFPKEPVPLPAIQKTADGLDRPEAPVRVEKEIKGKNLKRIVATDRPDCYVIVTPQQFEEFGKFEWRAVKSGHLYRRDGDEVIWLHREAAKCRADRFVAFRNGDQRDCRPSNLRVVATKDKLKELKLAARRAAGR